ncbi:hypothetical protein BTVI_139530 [Pitangus sulphuratus]|nr:hypothetical protein BTVI_139530 [Pitangus sulphuratus]
MWGTIERVVVKDINGKTQCRTKISLLEDEDGHLINRVMDKAEMFNTLFASVFNTDNRLRRSELEDHDCENDHLPVEPELVWDLLLQLDPYKSMGPDGIQLRIPKELVDDF